MTRALVTLAFVLFCVISAPLLVVVSAASTWYWPTAIALLAVWFVVGSPFIGAFVIVWLGDERPRFSPSDLYFEKRNYISWNSIHGWSRASHLFYECGLCHKTLFSNSEEMRTCGCGNVFVGLDHIGAQHPSKVRLYEQPA